MHSLIHSPNSLAIDESLELRKPFLAIFFVLNHSHGIAAPTGSPPIHVAKLFNSIQPNSGELQIGSEDIPLPANFIGKGNKDIF